MPAPGKERPQVRFGVQEGPQDEIELQDQVAYHRFTVPVRAELEMFLDFYGKEPRVSLMMLMLIWMSLSYRMTSSSGMARAPFSCPSPSSSAHAGPPPNGTSEPPRRPRTWEPQLFDNGAASGLCIVTGTTG